MSDLILLEGLEFNALIGVYDWERVAPRPLVLDLALETDLGPAAQSDAVADTVDYAQVQASVLKLAETEAPQLLERFAGRLIERLFAEFPRLAAITLTLHKPGILPGVRDVAIRLSRRRGTR